MNTKINAASSSSNIMQKVWDKLWRLCTPSKIKHFCWKALNEILPTKCNLAKRGLDVPLSCPICMNSIESTDHILFDCYRAREIWSQVCGKTFLDEDFNNSLGDRWLKISENTSKEELELVTVTCWSIWMDRNKKIHEEDIPPVNIRCNWVINYMEEFRKANLRTPVEEDRIPRNRGVEANFWIPPDEGVFKVNVDAAWSNNPSKTGYGAICRDSRGEVKGALASSIDLVFSPPFAELKTISEGLKLAKRLNCSKIIVESDCAQAVHFVSKQQCPWSDVEATVEEIWGIMADFAVAQIVLIPRKRNKVADFLAKEAKLSGLDVFWAYPVPEWVQALAVYDFHYLAQVAV